MKFLALSLTLLNLSSYTLAAPTTLLSSPITNVVSNIPTIPSTLGNTVSGLTKKDLPFLNTTTVATSPILKISSGITTLQSTLSPYIQVLTTTTTPLLTTPQLITSLQNIATALNTTTLAIAPAVQGVATPLTDVEITTLISSLGSALEVVNGVESAVTNLLSFIDDEIKADLKSEIITLLGLVMPLVNPLTGFAFGVVGTMTNSNRSEIKYSVDGLVNAATLLVSPVGPVLDALL